ncbi:MAG: c-type cytochrome [Saprospiraceae bacterium]|nr:c-type cytochrome [Saprospiraceae bacterium]
MNRKNKSVKFLSLLLGLLCPLFLSAQNVAEASGTTKDQTGFAFDLDTALFVMAFTLAVVIIILSGLVRSAFQYHFKNKMDSGKMKTIAILVMLAAANQSLFAKSANPSFAEKFIDTMNPQSWILLVVIAVELFILLYMVRWIKQFTGLYTYQRPQTNTKTVSWWDRINAFKPIEQEANMDTGHNYDGIRELDNITPPWFTAGFLATIVFAGIYMYRYHVAYSAPLMIEEYNLAMDVAEKEKLEFLKTESNLVDENTVTLLPSGQFEEGKTIFKTACAVCHGEAGQGTVGPNMTDDYWIHGGSVKQIFSVIKYGVIEKGMKSWKDDYSANQIAQLTSYIKSLRGTNPPGAKEPQGELYKEEEMTVAKDSLAIKDSAVTK